MKVIPGRLAGLVLIEPTVHGDARGFFLESYNRRDLAACGIHCEFVQDNHSGSARNVLRGLHFQVGHGQDKLVRVLRGEIYDVAVDIRPSSPTYGQWESVLLSAENRRILFVPVGFAHGFCVLSEFAEFSYKCSDYYSPPDESGIRWDDPDLAIPWPVTHPILSDRDRRLPRFRDLPHPRASDQDRKGDGTAD
jgi:dTDP-4-dehydrorhamnose 3,5-epimerase